MKVLVAQLCPTLCEPWIGAHQTPLTTGFSRQEYWSGLPFPSPGDLPDPGIKGLLHCGQTLHSLSHQGSPHDRWVTIKRNTLQIMGVSGEKEREKEIESLFKEITTENFPNLESDLDIQIYEVIRFPNSTQRYILQDPL